ncbi:MAG: hypothetical protein ACRECO_01990 [Xanthobacteraceae bacterium]
MPSKQACLQHAAELVRIAQDCDDPGKKIRLISMANAWLKFAERVEARDAARDNGHDGVSGKNDGGDTNA